MYNRLNINVGAFENRIFRDKYRPEIDVHNDPTPDWNIYEPYHLTDRELQMFKKRFSYKNPEELSQALIKANNEEYNDILKDLNIKQTVLRNQTENKVGIQLRRLKAWTKVVEDTLDSVKWHDNKPGLEREESAAQRRNESSSGQGLKILTPNQMLSRLPISLAQL